MSVRCDPLNAVACGNCDYCTDHPEQRQQDINDWRTTIALDVAMILLAVWSVFVVGGLQ